MESGRNISHSRKETSGQTLYNLIVTHKASSLVWEILETPATHWGCELQRPLCPIGIYLRTMYMLKDWACWCQTLSGMVVFLKISIRNELLELSMGDITQVSTHSLTPISQFSLELAAFLLQLSPLDWKPALLFFPNRNRISLEETLAALLIWPLIFHGLGQLLEEQVLLLLDLG